MKDSLESTLDDTFWRRDTIWTKPEEYDLSNDADRRILEKKFDGNEVASVIDRVDLVANELFSIDNPSVEEDDPVRFEYVDELLGQGSSYGRWFFYSWSGELVHFPGKEDHRRLRTARNRNLVMEEEQRLLYASTLAVFGMSVGSNVVDQLVLSGIGGKLILADPDTIEPTNLNRINGTFRDVGSSKVDKVARKISEVDPYIEQVHIKERVNGDVLSEIIELHQPDLLIDEVDDLRAKVAIRIEGSACGVPVLMATDLGDKSIVDVERYDLDKAKLFNGRLKEKVIATIISDGENPEVARKVLPKLIGIQNVTPRLLESFMEQGKTLAGVPQLGMTAAVGGALAALATREILLDRRLESGRYIFSPKEVLRLRSPTPLLSGIKTFMTFAKNANRQR